MSPSSNLPKPQPPPPPVIVTNLCKAQVVTRVTPTSRQAIKALSQSTGLTVQALGLYAWSLAMEAYGKPPLPEARG